MTRRYRRLANTAAKTAAKKTAAKTAELTLAAGLILLAVALPARAADERVPYVPAALEPWVDWVLEAHPNLACPRNAASGEIGGCAWTHALKIEVGRKLTFEQTVAVFARSRVRLPGDARLRPQAVTVDGQPAQVLGGPPALLLQPGRYQISGEINWGRRPTSVPIPDQFGLLDLVIDGSPRSRPQVRRGSLLLGQPSATPQPGTRDSLQVEVYRLIEDDYPLALSTLVLLSVSGRPRLERLGELLPEGFEVTGFDADLPARIAADGLLEVQLEAGEHELEISARALGEPTSIAFRAVTGNWPAQEVWAFEPNRQRRLVSLSGAPPIDLNQSESPYAEPGRSGYLLTSEQALTLTEEQQGRPSPLPNRYGIERALWLDFDGAGFISRDRINAEIRQPSRLTATYPLGRIDVDGNAELVNALADGAPGIELLTGTHRLEAVSRLDRDGELSATGWTVDADSLRISLQLPPGWRLLWATGADSVTGSWLARWRLWDLFLLVFTGVLAWRFLTPGFAVLLSATLLLTLQAAGGLAFCWLIAVGLVAASRRIEHPRIRPLIIGSTWAWLGITALIGIAFAVDQARSALYPQLETDVRQVTLRDDITMFGASDTQYRKQRRNAAESMDTDLVSSPAALEEIVVTATRRQPRRYSENLQIQTGPGEPNWNWRHASLVWNGPVVNSQPLDLTLAGPLLVRSTAALLAVLALGITGLLALGLWRAGRPEDRWPAGLPRAVLPIVLLGALLPAEPGSAASTPSAALLKDLETRLTRTPACFPNCASIERAEVQLSDATLSVTLVAHTGALVALPLPTSGSWQPSRIELGNEPAITARRDGALHSALPAGTHILRLSGAVSGLDRIELRFPLRPAAIAVATPADWRASGLIDGRLASGVLSFDRVADTSASKAAERVLRPDPIAPFVQVTRNFDFGLDWHLTTTVRRFYPSQGSFSLTVPLLAGEAVLDEDIEVTDAGAELVFGHREREKTWSSRLDVSSAIELTAPAVSDRRERWQFDWSNQWHLAHSGIHPVSYAPDSGPVFMPEAGDRLDVAISPTTPVAGDTVTVEQLTHAITAGARTQTHTLELSLRATQGGNWPLTLPGDAADNRLTQVTVNDRETPIPLADNVVALPLAPGETRYRLTWTSTNSLGLLLRAPRPTLASPGNNVTTRIEMPPSRWVLLLGGPTLGPAMLYWGLLLVVIVLALALARVPGLPVTRTDLILLSLGLTLNNLPATLLVAAWVLLLRGRRPLLERVTSRTLRNTLQISSAALTILTLATLVFTVPGALLGTPDMQITGNGSSAWLYQWYSDHTEAQLPGAWVLSLPLWVYRVAMLGWCLWLAFALIRWAQWAWREWSTPQIWYPRPPRTPPAESPTAS